MDQTINRQTIEQALYDADLEPEEDLRDDYSGRGMYGRNCFGFVTSIAGLARFFAALGALAAEDEELEQLPGDLARNLSSDSMGRDTIFYFPNFQLN